MPEPATLPLVGHPDRRAFWRAYLVYAVVMLPFFILLYGLAGGSGELTAVLIVHLGLLLFGALAGIRYARTTIWLDADGLHERGFLGRVSFLPTERIGGHVVLDLHRSLASRPTPQLFVLDTEDRLFCRMRGEYWSRGKIDRFAAALPGACTRPTHPFTLDEMQRNHADLLYWYERSPFRLA